jgi:hypothetical protein
VVWIVVWLGITLGFRGFDFQSLGPTQWLGAGGISAGIAVAVVVIFELIARQRFKGKPPTTTASCAALLMTLLTGCSAQPDLSGGVDADLLINTERKHYESYAYAIFPTDDDASLLQRRSITEAFLCLFKKTQDNEPPADSDERRGILYYPVITSGPPWDPILNSPEGNNISFVDFREGIRRGRITYEEIDILLSNYNYRLAWIFTKEFGLNRHGVYLVGWFGPPLVPKVMKHEASRNQMLTVNFRNAPRADVLGAFAELKRRAIHGEALALPGQFGGR